MDSRLFMSHLLLPLPLPGRTLGSFECLLNAFVRQTIFMYFCCVITHLGWFFSSLQCFIKKRGLQAQICLWDTILIRMLIPTEWTVYVCVWQRWQQLFNLQLRKNAHTHARKGCLAKPPQVWGAWVNPVNTRSDVPALELIPLSISSNCIDLSFTIKTFNILLHHWEYGWGHFLFLLSFCKTLERWWISCFAVLADFSPLYSHLILRLTTLCYDTREVLITFLVWINSHRLMSSQQSIWMILLNVQHLVSKPPSQAH